MPLPLPNLDTRRWADLIEEGRAQIPRYAPTWTDHNVHDPGITLMELMAWAVEQEIYRVNRVPEAHRLKFLQLLGFPPKTAQPATTVLSITPDAGETLPTLPSGVTFATTDPDGTKITFRTAGSLSVTNAAITGVQVWDGAVYADRTRYWRDGLPFPPLGDTPTADAEEPPALYLAFDQPLPVGQPVNLWLTLSDDMAHDGADRERLQAEGHDCGLDPFNHHGAETAWEYFDGSAWVPVEAVKDDTRALSRSGLVRLTLAGAIQPTEIGAIIDPQLYLRCRLVNGMPDAAPVLHALALNAVQTVQLRPRLTVFPIAPGVTPDGGVAPVVGKRQRLAFTLDSSGTITSLTVDPAADLPVLVMGYEAATATDSGSLTLAIKQVGTGKGLPNETFTVTSQHVDYADWTFAVFTLEGTTWQTGWQYVSDFDASTRTDRHFTFDAATGTVTFGDGERGRVVPDGARVFVLFEETFAAQGNNAGAGAWTLAGADDLVNAAYLADVEATAAQIASITQVTPVWGGADEETLEDAEARAARSLWAHERLVEYADKHTITSFDQQDRDDVLALEAPQRAVTILDYERLALDVPGTQIARAVAVPNVDPARPNYFAPGTVSVLVIPHLPPDAPMPTCGLLEAARRYLDRRRIVGTRLIVAAPRYARVSVTATVKAKDSAFPDRIQADVLAALVAFLDPLAGGAKGRGYPVGRDVYRAEILQVIDNVPGVDHVLALELFSDEAPEGCLNVCVGPLTLVTSGDHTITVE